MDKLTTYVALLRGINVGGHTLIRMARLKACFENLGFRNVQTYINSGNVILQSEIREARAIERDIEKTLVEQFSFPTWAVVRSLKEMQAIVAHIPSSWQTQADWRHNVIFLRHTVDSPKIVKQFALKPDIEELQYFPGVLFWSARISHLTKSNMLKVNRMPIYQEMTARGVNTARKIVELMQQAHEA